MRTMVLVLLLAGCSQNVGNARVKRWPTHRQETDARFAALEAKYGELESRLQTLEDFIARARIKSREKPSEPPPVDAGPAPVQAP